MTGFWELADKSGPVIWVLLAYSVAGLGLALERLVFFAFLGRSQASPDEYMNVLPPKNGSTPIDSLKGPEAAVVKAMLEAWKSGVADLGRVASRAGSFQLRRMERGFRTLSFFGNTAPLIGLFGTVLGMIKAFQVIQDAGGKVNASALAGGIWEAMLTTAEGLTVAIPILFILHMLEGMADGRAAVMKEYASVTLEKLGARSMPMADDRVVHPTEVADGI